MHQHVCDWHDKYRQSLPFPGRVGGEMVHRGANCHWGPGQDFTQDADFLSLPSLHSFYIITLPAQTPWGLFRGKSVLSMHTHGCSGMQMEDALFIPAQPSHHGPIHSLKCWACAIIPVELESRRAAGALTHPTIHYMTEVWPTSLCFLTAF